MLKKINSVRKFKKKIWFKSFAITLEVHCNGKYLKHIFSKKYCQKKKFNTCCCCSILLYIWIKYEPIWRKFLDVNFFLLLFVLPFISFFFCHITFFFNTTNCLIDMTGLCSLQRNRMADPPQWWVSWNHLNTVRQTPVTGTIKMHIQPALSKQTGLNLNSWWRWLKEHVQWGTLNAVSCFWC